MSRHLAAWCLWWAALFWLWLLLVGDWNRVELAGAAGAATVAATIAERLRALARAPLRPPLERVRASAGVPATVVADFAIVVSALARAAAGRRRVRGAFVTRPFDPGPKTTPAGAARRAWTVLLATYSPNAYVVDVDAERGTVLLHDLVPGRRSEAPA